MKCSDSDFLKGLNIIKILLRYYVYSSKNPNEIKENSTGNVKNGAKNFLNKGKNLFKKKDKNN